MGSLTLSYSLEFLNKYIFYLERYTNILKVSTLEIYLTYIIINLNNLTVGFYAI